MPSTSQEFLIQCWLGAETATLLPSTSARLNRCICLENRVEAGKHPKIFWGKVHACVCVQAWCASSCAHASPLLRCTMQVLSCTCRPCMLSQPPPPPAACHVSVTSCSSFLSCTCRPHNVEGIQLLPQLQPGGFKTRSPECQATAAC